MIWLGFERQTTCPSSRLLVTRKLLAVLVVLWGYQLSYDGAYLRSMEVLQLDLNVRRPRHRAACRYIRLVSGFLDKMVPDNRRQHDWRTLYHVNQDLKLPDRHEFASSVADFHRFVRMLNSTDINKINDHFQPQVLAGDKGLLLHTYHLRLEDMAHWLPCFVEGLQLHKFTSTGWQQRPLMYVGAAESDGCFWSPPGMSCAEFAAATTDSEGRAQPLPRHNRSAVMPGQVSHDFHTTDANGKFLAYYTPEIEEMVYNLYQADFEVFGFKRAVFDGMRLPV